MSELMDLGKIKEEISGFSLEQLLLWASNTFTGKIVFSSSFGAEDMVILEVINRLKLPIEIITLDTGRLPKETYELIEKVKRQYGMKIVVYYPNQQEVEELVTTKGFFSFRNSVEDRKECCKIRKVNSLKRALEGKKLWITGLRKSQSVTREDIDLIENDSFFKIIKLNPLIEWNEEDVWGYIKKHNVPYNRLHDEGFPSIGCEPCTRKVKFGDDIRSGRWWWENENNKECGLHLSPKNEVINNN